MVEQVRDIVQHLDHLPLPIELAAARLPRLSLGQIQRRLTKRFERLESGEWNRSPRKDTMWSAIDWSWHQLSNLERWILVQCGAFRESFSVDAAEAIIISAPLVGHRSVRDVVVSLVAKSLIQGYRTEEGLSRLSLLRSIREYVTHRLTDPTSVVDGMQRPVTGAQARIKLDTRHRRYFIRLDGRTDIMSLVRAPLSANPGVAAHAADVQAAIDGATREGEYPLAARGWVMAWYRWLSLEGPFLLVAERCGRLGRQPGLDPHWRGWMHYLECLAWQSAGHSPSALEAAESGLLQMADGRNSILESLLRTARAAVLAQTGRYDGVLDEYRAGLTIQQASDEPVLAAVTLTQIGRALLELGALDEAENTLTDALTAHGETQNRRYEGITAGAIGRLQITLGNFSTAELWFREALSAFGKVGDQRQIGHYRTLWARLDLTRGSIEPARENVTAALQIHRRIGDASGEAAAITVSAMLQAHDGEYESADVLFRQALGKARFGQELEMECLILGEIGGLALDVGDLNLARNALEEAVERGEHLSASSLARVRADLAAACAHTDGMDEAAAHLTAAESAKAVPPHILGQIECRRAEVHLLAGRVDAARNALVQAAKVVQKLGLHYTSPLALRIQGLVRDCPPEPIP